MPLVSPPTPPPITTIRAISCPPSGLRNPTAVLFAAAAGSGGVTSRSSALGPVATGCAVVTRMTVGHAAHD